MLALTVERCTSSELLQYHVRLFGRLSETALDLVLDLMVTRD